MAPCKKNKVPTGKKGRCVYKKCPPGQTNKKGGECRAKPCRDPDYERLGARCKKKCRPDQRRKKGVCRTFTKAGHRFNEITNRFVLTDGPTGKWVQGIGPNPYPGKKITYSAALAKLK